MNLLQSDVFSARAALSPLGIEKGQVSCGWHNGQISVVISCPIGTKEEVLKVLEQKTTISIPIIIEEDFKPQW